MRKFSMVVLTFALVTFGSLSAVLAAAKERPQLVASAALVDVSGKVVGNALLTAVGRGPVRVQAWVGGLAPGQHGFHIHAVGACTPDFAAAGGHFNPSGAKHGTENPEGAHAGDLPNLVVGADGNGAIDLITNRVSLAGGSASLFDADGSALVIHANADDYRTDPTGNSGGRIACGVIAEVEAPAASRVASAPLMDASGKVVGNALLTAVGSGPVRVQAWVGGLAPGQHGFHIHAVGACTPDFAAAGGHFNPSGAKHGTENPEGAHAGDLPNLVVGADGNGAIDLITNRVSLAGGSASLFDADGSALVIHANADDYRTDPTGNSGGRIACGVIRELQ